MRTQTKCTLALSGLFILELLPIPFTAIYSLYVTRNRPDWLPGVVERLYEDKENRQKKKPLPIKEHDSMVTRRRCTISLSVMFILDIAIPFTVILALYITRRRPFWFKKVVHQLYADKLTHNETIEANSKSSTSNTLDNETIEKRYIALQKSNIDFAFRVAGRAK